MTTPCPFDEVTECVHLRAADLQSDITGGARSFYRRLTEAEVSEISGAVVKVLVDKNRSDLWLTANDFITLCATHSHS